jgi:hypothetical protein
MLRATGPQNRFYTASGITGRLRPQRRMAGQRSQNRSFDARRVDGCMAPIPAICVASLDHLATREMLFQASPNDRGPSAGRRVGISVRKLLSGNRESALLRHIGPIGIGRGFDLECEALPRLVDGVGPEMARLPVTTALFSSAVPAARLFAANFGRSELTKVIV